MNISFGKKTGLATSEASRIDIAGVQVSHLGSRGVVFIQGTVMAADTLYMTGIGIGIPDDPKMIQDTIDALDKLKQYLEVRHVR